MRVEIVSSGVVKLPTGVTVGDEFRIAGKVRVAAISEDLVDVTSYATRWRDLTGGERSYTLVLSEVEPT